MIFAKKKVRIQTPLFIPIIDLEIPFEKIVKKCECIVIRCHKTSGVAYSVSFDIRLPYYGGGSSEDLLVWKDKSLKALEGQGISIGPQRFIFTPCLKRGDTKATFNQAVPDVVVCTVIGRCKS